MSTITADRQKVLEQSVKWVASEPVTFLGFLELVGPDDDVELIDGVVVEKMAVQLEHQKLFAWLMRLMGDYVEARDLGIVLGSRTLTEISEFRGRLPDLLFVRKDRMEIVQQKAIFGAPDLIVELVSPNDRPSDIISLETDYRTIGVTEIWIIDQQKQRVRILRKHEVGYDEAWLTAGTLSSETVPGFQVELEWLLQEPRPAVLPTLERLLNAAGS
jgi:Uma2 family endonuclease